MEEFNNQSMSRKMGKDTTSPRKETEEQFASEKQPNIQATKKYEKRYPDDKNYVPKFSYFAELYQSKVLKSWLEEDPTRLDYFIDLVGQNKLLLTYRGVRNLAKIV